MWNWFKRTEERESLPEYVAVRTIPSRGLPSELQQCEMSEAFFRQREEVERSICEPQRRPRADKPLFVELLAASGNGIPTITSPEGGGPCLPVFSSAFRAADYARVHLDRGPGVKYLTSSPLQLVTMLRDVRALGIETFALDRCPRCDIFTLNDCASITTADDAVNCWSMFDTPRRWNSVGARQSVVNRRRPARSAGARRRARSPSRARDGRRRRTARCDVHQRRDPCGRLPRRSRRRRGAAG